MGEEKIVARWFVDPYPGRPRWQNSSCLSCLCCMHLLPSNEAPPSGGRNSSRHPATAECNIICSTQMVTLEQLVKFVTDGESWLPLLRAYYRTGQLAVADRPWAFSTASRRGKAKYSRALMLKLFPIATSIRKVVDEAVEARSKEGQLYYQVYRYYLTLTASLYSIDPRMRLRLIRSPEGRPLGVPTFMALREQMSSGDFEVWLKQHRPPGQPTQEQRWRAVLDLDDRIAALAWALSVDAPAGGYRDFFSMLEGSLQVDLKYPPLACYTEQIRYLLVAYRTKRDFMWVRDKIPGPKLPACAVLYGPGDTGVAAAVDAVQVPNLRDLGGLIGSYAEVLTHEQVVRRLPALV